MKKDNPFSALESLRSQLPPGPSKPSPPKPAGPARAVVRLERKGRAGKEVTVVEQLGLGGKELERWCGELKKALGCGGKVEGDGIVLQGDQRDRLPELFERRGVRKVSVG